MKMIFGIKLFCKTASQNFSVCIWNAVIDVEFTAFLFVLNRVVWKKKGAIAAGD